jgi:hypothetical protein
MAQMAGRHFATGNYGYSAIGEQSDILSIDSYLSGCFVAFFERAQKRLFAECDLTAYKCSFLYIKL